MSICLKRFKNLINTILLFSLVIFLSCSDISNDSDDNLGSGNVTNLENIMNEDLFKNLFPYRADLNYTYNGDEFYSYKSLQDAILELSNVKLTISNRIDESLAEGIITYSYKLTRENISTGAINELIVGSDHNASWNTSKPEANRDVYFSDFVSDSNTDLKRKELAAFLANISHETTGGGSSDIAKDKGLWFKEEITPDNLYADSTNLTFPPVAGQSYHGRGPMQLSWNYNYGLYSFVAYGDKNILLDNPAKVLENGKSAFMASLYFWMFPEGNKDSAHEAIKQERGFARTIDIINGGLECFPAVATAGDYRVMDRVDFFKKYANEFGYTIKDSDTALQCYDKNFYD